MPIIIPQGSYTLPVCLEDPDSLREIVNAMDLWRRMHNKGVQSDTMTAVLNAVDTLLEGEGSPCLEASEGTSLGTCYRMDTSTEVFDFYPNDPFNPGDEGVTTIGMSWLRLEDILSQDILPDWIEALISATGNFIGYFPNDCFVSYELWGDLPFPDFSNFWEGVQELLFPFPTVTFKVQGEGEMEIQFCQAPLGGRVLVTWDFAPTIEDISNIATGNYEAVNFSNFQLLELNIDTFSLPFELVPTITTEIQLSEDIEHTIRCIFMPALDDSPPFIFPFSGIREIEFCGNLKVVGSQTDTVYDQNNYKSFGATREGFIMATKDEICEGMLCAMETVAQRILLASVDDNINSGVSIDDNGQVVKDTDLTSTTPVVSASTLERICGGYYFQAQQLAKLFSKIETWRATYSPSLVQQFVNGFLNDLGEDAYAFFVSEYLADPVTIFTINVPDLAEQLYCTGNFLQGVIDYGVENPIGAGNTEREANLAILIDLAQGVAVTTAKKWFDEGYQTPRNEYLGYACVLRPDTEIIYTADMIKTNFDLDTDLVGNWIISAPRLVRVTFSGSIIANDGTIFTARWTKEADGSIDDSSWNRIKFGNFGISVLPPIEQAYNPEGAYSHTVELHTAGDHNSLRLTPSINTADFSQATGAITCLIQDLGDA